MIHVQKDILSRYQENNVAVINHISRRSLLLSYWTRKQIRNYFCLRNNHPHRLMIINYSVKLIIIYDKRISKKTLQIQYLDFVGNKNILSNFFFMSGAMKNKQELLTIEGHFRWPPVFGRYPCCSTSCSVLCFVLVCVSALSLLN